MSGGKKKGQSSLKKVIGSTTTRSKVKQQRQQHEIDSLASLSSPVTSHKSKKLSPIRKQKQLSPIDDTSPQKQAVVDSLEPEQETMSPVVVTETKRKQKK